MRCVPEQTGAVWILQRCPANTQAEPCALRAVTSGQALYSVDCQDTRVTHHFAQRRRSLNQMNLSLIEAFGKFGAKPRSRVGTFSATAPDGALVLNCSLAHFGHPAQGVLRYEDRLSRETAHTKKDIELLGEDLTLARDGALPIRMVVASAMSGKRGGRGFHVRWDLIGKLVKFDGDHFVVDFTRQQEILEMTASVRPKKGSALLRRKP
jgi:hypothetical protein